MIEASSHPSKAAATKSPEQEILQYISQFTSLNDAEAKGVLDSLNIRVFKKGTLLLGAKARDYSPIFR